MSPEELNHYLHTHIPITRHMGVSAVAVSETTVALTAPLEPNVNPHGTVFGGSAGAVGMLAAWSLVYTRLLGEGVEARLVVRQNSMSFRRPIDGSLIARAELAQEADWTAFLEGLRSRGRAAVPVVTVIERDGRPAAWFEGEFVAIAE